MHEEGSVGAINVYNSSDQENALHRFFVAKYAPQNDERVWEIQRRRHSPIQQNSRPETPALPTIPIANVILTSVYQ
jgi:hypothetical protein